MGQGQNSSLFEAKMALKQAYTNVQRLLRSLRTIMTTPTNMLVSSDKRHVES